MAPQSPVLNNEGRVQITFGPPRERRRGDPTSRRGWDVPGKGLSSYVLTEEESNFRVGTLTTVELHSKLLELWSGMFKSFKHERRMFRDIGPEYANRTLMSRAPYLQGTWEDQYNQWLSYFITKNQDFGLVHAWAAIFFRSEHPLELGDCAPDCEPIDGIAAPQLNRRVEPDNNGNPVVTTDSDHCPRRIWDICANRVIPFSWFLPPGGRVEVDDPKGKKKKKIEIDEFETDDDDDDDSGIFFETAQSGLTAVSHAWVAAEDLQYVVTPVNEYLWPVPLPKGITLEDVRRQLISVSARYAWLDVLCLRQPAVPRPDVHLPVSQDIIMLRESRRLQELETDVPLVGNHYTCAGRVAVYLSGLGKLFTPTGWQHECHWIRRISTMQETKGPHETSFMGMTGPRGWGGSALEEEPWNCNIDDTGTTLENTLRKILTPEDYHRKPTQLKTILEETRHRVAPNPVDKVAGLFYFFKRDSEWWTTVGNCPVPVYKANEDPALAWNRLISGTASLDLSSTFEDTYRFHGFRNISTPLIYQMLMLFPHPSAEHWFPSWAQVMADPDMSQQEPQLPDGIPPAMSCSLRIPRGWIYHNITLHRIDAGNHSYYRAIGRKQARRSKKAVHKLIGTNPDGSLPDTGILSGQAYTLVDITPGCLRTNIEIPKLGKWRTNKFIRMLWPLDADRDYSVWNYPGQHIFLVCRELCKWSSVTKKYRLRRVTTLLWNETGGATLEHDRAPDRDDGSDWDEADIDWDVDNEPDQVPRELPFKGSMIMGMDTTTRDLWSRIEVTLQ